MTSLKWVGRSRPTALWLASINAVALVAAGGGAQAALAAAGTTPVAPLSGVRGEALGEVVVTAEHRSTQLERTPAAISAVSAHALDQSFVTQVSGLNAVVPSLEITQASGFENLVSIRGVGSETPENSLVTTPGVSEFIDGVYIANSISLDQTLFDIDRIEVLRGPQGDLYGESATGGVINIVTRQPELSAYGASGDVSGGTYDLVRARAEVNLPLTDTVAVRASVQKYSHEGFTDDTYFPDFREDDADDTSGKAAVLWKPNDAFSATLTGQWYNATENGAAQKNIDDPEPDPRELYQDYPSRFRLTTGLYHLNLAYDTPWFRISSVTGYQYLSNVTQEDSSRSAFSLIGSYDDVAAWNTKLNNYSEEFDLLSLRDSPVEWDLGAFAVVQTSKQFIAEFEGKTDPDTDPGLLQVAPDIETAPPSKLAYGNASHTARQGYAGFFRATIPVAPRLRLTLGGRINHDSYTGDSFNFSGLGSDTVSHAYTDTVPTGKTELDYDLEAANLIYASASRGYKPGGLNGQYGQLVVPDTFKPETNTAFEVGSKNSFLGKTLQLNLAAYYYLYRNMQYIEYDPVPFHSGIANIPLIHEYGIEAEGGYVSRDGRLRLDGDLALENGMAEGNYKTINSTLASAVENDPGPCPYGPNTFYTSGAAACAAAVEASAESISGRRPPDMPLFSGAAAVSYRFDIPTGALTPRAQYVYRGSEWARIFNVPALDRLDSYGVTNLNLDYVPTGSNLRVSLTATNVFDVNGVNSRYTDPYGTGSTSQQYIAPRQIVGTIAFSF